MVQFPLFIFRNKIYVYIKKKTQKNKIQELQWQALATCQAHSICLLRSFTELKGVQLILHFADDKNEVWRSQLSNLTSALRFGLIRQDHRVKW